MKIISGMLGVLMLTLLPLPSHAKTVFAHVITYEYFSKAGNLAGLDARIQTAPNEISDWFSTTTDLTLRQKQALLIRGGGGSIGKELDYYKQRSIIGTSLLKAYGCYKRNGLGKDNATYVLVSHASDGFAMQPQWCDDHRELISGGSINVGQLSTKVKQFRKKE
jgi:hypothetical protein